MTASDTSQLDFHAAAKRLSEVVSHTPLAFNKRLSEKYGSSIYLKREDLQIVRSYKLRGAYNMISQLSKEELSRGVVCASAGNHAQGFAFSCARLKVKGVIFMPTITPAQKINQTRMHGGQFVEIKLIGDTFDDCAAIAKSYTLENDMTFIPPFDHNHIIEGQGTVGVEILMDQPDVDYIFIPVGGGGLAAGLGTYVKNISPKTKLIGLEPEGAPSMQQALLAGKPVRLPVIDPFVDGAAVKQVGEVTFPFCQAVLDQVKTIPEGKVCSTILSLYNQDAIVAEPAGALSIAALDYFSEEIKGKIVICIVSGGNNDIDRMQEIKERSLQFEGLKHYFLIQFAQRPGALKEFVNYILGPDDDITRFEYMQKQNKETGPALVGIELKQRNDYQTLLDKLESYHINYTELNKNDTLFGYLV